MDVQKLQGLQKRQKCKERNFSNYYAAGQKHEITKLVTVSIEQKQIIYITHSHGSARVF